ncbi:MAG: CoA ester lyase [Halocynthiibacter sp.]
MTQSIRPYRSVLYIPGSNARALAKARSLPADAIIFDLEDAVAVGEKFNARKLLGQELATGGYGARVRIVRINAIDSLWGQDDAEAVCEMQVDGVLLAKVNSPDDVSVLATITGDIPVWAMMETPRGILNAAEIAAHPLVVGFVIGTNDLAKELGSRNRPDRMPVLSALSLCLLAARAHGVIAIDGVYNAFKDDTGLRAECEQGRDMGFDGKSLIHPSQLATANAVFAPSEADIRLAHRQIGAFEEAQAEGRGVAVLDGRIVESLHVESARKILLQAEAIAAAG